MLRSCHTESLDKPERLATAHGIAWCSILVITLAAAASLYWNLIGGLQSDSRHLASDFVVFWTAARSLSPYDFEALSQAQHWYMNTETLRPFAYPPSFIPWLKPLAALPMWQAFLLWTGATAALFAIVWSRIVGLGQVLAGLVAPIAIFAIVPGQMIFLLGALVVGGVALIDRRPLVAGLLLGAAATIKPQALLLVPCALAASAQWRALVSAVATGTIMGTMCVVIQGPGPWIAWLDALPRFLRVIHESGMIEYGITPASWLDNVGLEGAAAAGATLAFALSGTLAVWHVFRSSRDIRYRILALTSGTMLVLPYGMPYELVVAAPAAASLLLDRRQAPLTWLASFAFLTAAGQTLAVALMAGTIAWLAARASGSGTACAIDADPAPSRTRRPAKGNR